MCKVAIWPTLKIFSNIQVLMWLKKCKFSLNDFEIWIQEFIRNCLYHSISGSWKCQCHLMIQMVGLRPIKGIKCSYSILSPPLFFKWISDFCESSSIKRMSGKVTTNFHWGLRILKLLKVYIKDLKEYIGKIGG